MKRFAIFTAVCMCAALIGGSVISSNSPALASAMPASPHVVSYKIIPAKSSVKWHAKKVTGEHYGMVKVAGGSLGIDHGQLSKGTCTIDMTGITCTDLKDAKYNTKLVNHLKSDDFFSVEKHPKASFKLESLKYNIKSENPDYKYDAKGQLTIKGITHPITFPATVSMEKGKVVFKALMTFDRSKYNIKYNSGSFFENLGDKLIYDDVELTVNIVAEPV